MNQTGGRLQSWLWVGLRIYIEHSVWRERIYYYERFEDLEL